MHYWINWDGRKAEEGATLKQVWVYAEQQLGQWTSATRDLLLAARKLADRLQGELTAVVCGWEISSLVSELQQWGVHRVLMAENEAFRYYNPIACTEAVTQIMGRFGCPEMLLFSATYLGRDLAPAVAARLGTGCAADCCALDLDAEGNLLQIVPGLGGTIFATIVTPHHRPQVATVKPGMLEVEEKDITPVSSFEVIGVEVQLPEASSTIQLRETRRKPSREATLETARRVVAGGAGIGGKEGWALIEELAAAMDAAVGATRPAVDEGWAAHDQMIGQSGKTVRPELYIGIGVSGDMMHTVGIKGKGIRVAINQDPKAPIFKQVDYGIVADYQEVVPVLLEELRRRKGTTK